MSSTMSTYHQSGFKSTPIFPKPNRIVIKCNTLPIKTISPATTSSSDPSPVLTSVTAFAPATVANLGPCFDFLGAAVSSLGDHVTLSLSSSVPPGTLSISHVSGTSRPLSLSPLENCAGIAAVEVMKALGVRSVGLSLSLSKGLPLGSGLGSSAASAAAGALAVNALFGSPLDDIDLVRAGLESERKVSGYHADNIAPAVMGGFVLIANYQPLDLKRLKFPESSELFFVLVSPKFEAPTKKMRAALLSEIPMADHVWNSSQGGALVAALMEGDLAALGKAMSGDRVVEPRRGPLIPGFREVKESALGAGAFGCTISGAGPTVVAITDGEERGREIGERMVEAFLVGGGLKAKAVVSRLDRVGARIVSSTQ